MIQIQNLSKNYGNATALKNISVDIPRNSIFALLGPNGAGKSTLIRTIAKILKPDSGNVIINNQYISLFNNRQIGYLPEERGLYKNMKVGEHAIYLANLKGLNKLEAESRLKIWFEKLDIQDWWEKNISNLSKGMQQKVQFIVSVIHNPKLLILDEPFSGLDPINYQIIVKELIDINKNGTTIILSTHDMNSVEKLCDHIMLLNRGENILSGNINEIRKNNNKIIEIVHTNNNEEIKKILSQNAAIISSEIIGENYVTILEISKNASLDYVLTYNLDKIGLVSLNEVKVSIEDIFLKSIK